MKLTSLLIKLTMIAGLLDAWALVEIRYGLASLVVVLAIDLALSRIRQNIRQTRSLVHRARVPAREPFLQCVKWSAIAAFIGTALGVTAVDGAQWVSRSFRRLDADRPEFEIELSDLASHGQWEQVIARISDRLAEEASDDWSQILRQRQQSAFLHGGLERQSVERRHWFHNGTKHATEHQLDSIAFQALLELMERVDSAEADSARQAANLAAVQNAMTLQADQLNHQVQAENQKGQALAAELQALRSTHEEFARRAPQEQLETLLAWADDLSFVPDRQITRLEVTKNFAQQHQLPTEAIDSRLTQARARLVALQPATLPAGCTAAVRQVRVDLAPPAIVVEFSLSDRDGKHVAGLKSKDFQIVGDRHAGRSHAVYEVTPAAVPLQLAFAFDVSGSMKGAALVSAKEGAQALLQQLSGHADFRLLAFSDAVRDLTDWISNSDEAVRALNPLRADGGTALFQAIERALGAVTLRTGPKAILAFTDGLDTEGKADIQLLIERCRQQQVAVHIIALNRQDLDLAFIKQVTSQTGGTFVSANRERDLGDQFLTVAKELRAPRYRLAVLGHDSPNELNIRIGGERSIDLRVTRNSLAPVAGR